MHIIIADILLHDAKHMTGRIHFLIKLNLDVPISGMNSGKYFTVFVLGINIFMEALL